MTGWSGCIQRAEYQQNLETTEHAHTAVSRKLKGYSSPKNNFDSKGSIILNYNNRKTTKKVKAKTIKA